jgi:NAD(P)-dependent dehydrogenase (short-subunit alcohol dehydrogenase family)
VSVVLVTGAGRGLGKATAEAFLVAGADLVLHYHAAEAGAREVARQAEAAGRRAVVVAGDLTRGEDARRVVAAAGATSSSTTRAGSTGARSPRSPRRIGTPWWTSI